VILMKEKNQMKLSGIISRQSFKPGNFYNIIADLWEEIINFIFPAKGLCLLCWEEYSGTPQRGICARCRETVLALNSEGRACRLCGRFTIETECPNCHGQGLAGLAGVISVVPYQGQYRELIQQLKFGGQQELSRPLGYLMGEKWKQVFPDCRPDIIVPVPLEPRRHFERGFNQSSLLGMAVSRSLRRPLREDCLLRGSGKADQTTLGRRERIANTAQAFRAGEGVRLTGRTVLLIDDIITTGATLAACASVLQEMGAKTVWGITWAAGIRQIIQNY